jgi:hypothetical protein
MDTYTHITYVLDRSGSMSSVQHDIVGGFKAYLDEQKKQEGKCTFSLVQFDDRYEKNFWFADINLVPSNILFQPRGNTALYDAIGKAINDTGMHLSYMREEDRPQKVLMVIHTDGEENASREYTKAAIKEMIQHQEEKYSWKIAFIGTNFDVMAEGSSIGVAKGSTLAYVNSSTGINTAYASLNRATSGLRSATMDCYMTTSGVFNNDEDDEVK